MSTYHTTLTAATSTDINVGLASKHSRIDLFCKATRGELEAVGKITVQSVHTDSVEETPAYSLDFDDVGITSMTVSLDGDNILLSIAVDNSSEDDITFDYNLKRIINRNKIASP